MADLPRMFPEWLDRIQIKYMNPVIRPLAGRLPGIAKLTHRGRRSGRTYQTPVTAYRSGGEVAIVLGHGETDWVVQCMATGLTHGVRRGYWSIAGLEVGLMLQLALVAIGLGAAVANSILAFHVIKWIGVAYLLYLAVHQWRAAAVDLRAQVGRTVDGGRIALLVRGFLVNATNPKGLVFFLAVLPQFVVPTAPLLPQYLAIGATMVAVDLVVMGLYTGLAARLIRWLHTPRQQTILNRALSGLFAAAAVVLSLVRRGGPATA